MLVFEIKNAKISLKPSGSKCFPLDQITYTYVLTMWVFHDTIQLHFIVNFGGNFMTFGQQLCLAILMLDIGSLFGFVISPLIVVIVVIVVDAFVISTLTSTIIRLINLCRRD
jgi:hypothetical protein